MKSVWRWDSGADVGKTADSVKSRNGGPALDVECDLEEFRPILAGDEEAIAVRVVGDAVQHIGLPFHDIRGCEQAGQVDRADDVAVMRIAADYPIGLPDVGIELPFHPFQLVQILDRFALERDLNPPDWNERLRIQQANLRTTVAHQDLFAVLCQSPTFSV